CLNYECVMNYSSNLEKVDNKSIFLCTLCSQRLEDIRDRKTSETGSGALSGAPARAFDIEFAIPG
ncbi:MAG: hypothetical protein P8188_19025, partial [Gemmatimonadota bacterium]